MAKTSLPQGKSGVAVIIPTLLAQPSWLERTIVSLDKQVCAMPFDIIVVVNASEDALKNAKSKLDLKSVKNPIHWLVQGKNTGFTNAVNRGIRASKRKFVALLNDDVWVSPKWLQALLDVQKQTKVDMVASTIYAPRQASYDWPINKAQWWLDSCGFDFAWRGKAWPLIPSADGELRSPLTGCWDNWQEHVDMLGKQAASDTQQPFGADGAAALYTRKLFNKIGPFKRSFFAYLEDVELALRARQAGFVCRWAPKAIAYHGKHVTATGLGTFKAKQDVKNWWRMLFSFPFEAWWRFGVSILVERLRNVSGLLKQL